MNRDKAPKVVVRLTQSAITDIVNQANYYSDNAPKQVAVRFRKSIQTAVDHLAAYPESGVMRQVVNTRLSGLRMWHVTGFPSILIFYIYLQGELTIVRILHGSQDTQSILEEE